MFVNILLISNMLREMHLWDMKPNTITCSAAICACETCREWITKMEINPLEIDKNKSNLSLISLGDFLDVEIYDHSFGLNTPYFPLKPLPPQKEKWQEFKVNIFF